MPYLHFRTFFPLIFFLVFFFFFIFPSTWISMVYCNNRRRALIRSRVYNIIIIEREKSEVLYNISVYVSSFLSHSLSMHIPIYVCVCVSNLRAEKEKKDTEMVSLPIKKETQSYLSIINVTPIAVQYCTYSIIFVSHYWLRLLKRLPNRLWKYIDERSFSPLLPALDIRTMYIIL